MCKAKAVLASSIALVTILLLNQGPRLRAEGEPDDAPLASWVDLEKQLEHTNPQAATLAEFSRCPAFAAFATADDRRSFNEMLRQGGLPYVATGGAIAIGDKVLDDGYWARMNAWAGADNLG